MKTPILCVVACLSASVVLAQGLGEAARKEQERRKKAAAESGARTPTYGNAELLETPKGKGTFSANVADTSGESETPAPVVIENETMPPPGIANEGHAQPAAEGPEQTDMDRFKAKLARWRAAFLPLKARVDALEREVADLEPKASRDSGVGVAPGKPIYDPYRGIVGYESSGGGGPRPLHEGEAARMRLPKARQELAAAKQALADVENQARRDGIAPGQLY
jgi:hypothetical protein